MSTTRIETLVKNIEETASKASPGPWRWCYDREGTRYETRTPKGWLIETRDVDSEVPDEDWDRYPAGSVSLRGPEGSAKSETFPDLPVFILRSLDEPPDANDARYISSVSPDQVLSIIQNWHDLREAVGLLQSVIRSGESWSDQCTQAVNRAMMRAQ